MESSRIHGGEEADSKSSNESGWTTYLVSSPMNEKLEKEFGGESDDSTSSDATSGLSHEGLILCLNKEISDHPDAPLPEYPYNSTGNNRVVKIKDSEKLRNKKAGEMKHGHEPKEKSAVGGGGGGGGDQCDVFCGEKIRKGK